MESLTWKSYIEYLGAISFPQLHVKKCINYAALGSEVQLLNSLDLFISMESFTIDVLILPPAAYQITMIFNNHYRKKRYMQLSNYQ